jgi:DNA-binding IclR family transcriptional regulator
LTKFALFNKLFIINGLIFLYFERDNPYFESNFHILGTKALIMGNLSSLEKAIRILNLFSIFRLSMDVNEISKELGFPKSTVYRLIKVLSKHELMEQDSESRGYRLGIRLFQMGNTVKYQRKVGDIARPLMEELRNITKETVLLAVIEGRKALVLREVEGTHSLRISFDEVRSLPLHAGASSKILLAYLPIEEQDRIIQEGLTRYTEHTITDPVELKRELARIRENDYAYSDQELDIAASAIAAPIRNFSGKVIAGLSLAGSAYRFDEETVKKFIVLVKEYAEKISKMMGFGSGTINQGFR